MIRCCHSERSEESAFLLRHRKQNRFFSPAESAGLQNDTPRGFFNKLPDFAQWVQQEFTPICSPRSIRHPLRRCSGLLRNPARPWCQTDIVEEKGARRLVRISDRGAGSTLHYDSAFFGR